MGPHYANFAAITDSLREVTTHCASPRKMISPRPSSNSSAIAPPPKPWAGAPGKSSTARPAPPIAALPQSSSCSPQVPARERSAMKPAPAARPLLWPLVPAYRLALALRELQLRAGLKPVRRLRWPVVSIGNLSTGGAGKTPLTIALAKALSARGLHVDVLSRGYGRRPPRFHFWLTPAAQRKNSATSRCSSRAKPTFPSMSPPNATKRACWRRTASEQRERGSGKPACTFARRRLSASPARPRRRHSASHRRDMNDHLLPAGNLREPLLAAVRAHVIAIPADEPEVEAQLKSMGWQGTQSGASAATWKSHTSTAPSPPFAASRGPISSFRVSKPPA